MKNFPYESIRPQQDVMIESVQKAVTEKKSILIEAPTGIGKTVASLAPIIEYAIENKKKIFFLTSRQTQHHLAVNTLKDISTKIPVKVADIIAKRDMCTFPGTAMIPPRDFIEFCISLREQKQCVFYENSTKPKGKKAMETINATCDYHVESVVKVCLDEEVCPYEITVKLAKKANVFVADYYIMFNPHMRRQWFNKLELQFEDCIVIVDEAHNLPERIRNLMSSKLTSEMLKRGIKEAKKNKETEIIPKLVLIQDALIALSKTIKDPSLTTKNGFMQHIKKQENYDDLIDDLIEAGDRIRKAQKASYVHGIAEFLDKWKTDEEGFIRIIAFYNWNKETMITLTLRCLDPSILTQEVFSSTHSNILMSGTLEPLSMYKDILGIPQGETLELSSPFAKENRLTIIDTATTTQYNQRNPKMYTEMSNRLTTLVNTIKGNVLVFFPSYAMRDQLYPQIKTSKQLILEKQGSTKEQKKHLLKEFGKHKDKGAVLLATSSGNFGEGIDLPGDLLQGVIIVGLPLQPPDIETLELIKYYDNKFSKGKLYGYVFPAFMRIIQNAGRLIRTETDRGVIVFMDNRYIWPSYKQCFPPEYDLIIGKTEEYVEKIKEFFSS